MRIRAVEAKPFASMGDPSCCSLMSTVYRHLSAAVLAITLAWPLAVWGQQRSRSSRRVRLCRSPLGRPGRRRIGALHDRSRSRRSGRGTRAAARRARRARRSSPPKGISSRRCDSSRSLLRRPAARYRLMVELGRRTTVGALELKFTGALSEPRLSGARRGVACAVVAPSRCSVSFAAVGKPPRLSCWLPFRRGTSPERSWRSPRPRSTQTRHCSVINRDRQWPCVHRW